MIKSVLVKAQRGDKKARATVLTEYRLLIKSGEEVPRDLLDFVGGFMESVTNEYRKSKDGRVSLNQFFPNSPAKKLTKDARVTILNEYRLMIKSSKDVPKDLFDFVDGFMEIMTNEYKKTKDGRVSLNQCFPDSPAKESNHARNHKIVMYVRHCKLILGQGDHEAILFAAKEFKRSEQAIYSAIESYEKEAGKRMAIEIGADITE
jgi:sulfur relay (sulfurtransferase) DsrC/TusE family protein